MIAARLLFEHISMIFFVYYWFFWLVRRVDNFVSKIGKAIPPTGGK